MKEARSERTKTPPFLSDGILKTPIVTVIVIEIYFPSLRVVFLHTMYSTWYLLVSIWYPRNVGGPFNKKGINDFVWV